MFLIPPDDFRIELPELPVFDFLPTEDRSCCWTALFTAAFGIFDVTDCAPVLLITDREDDLWTFDCEFTTLFGVAFTELGIMETRLGSKPSTFCSDCLR